MGSAIIADTMRNPKSPLVSVVIPTFNSKIFYKPCLKSLAQLKYRNFEALIVDDGSYDGSFEEIKSKYAKDKRFVVIQTFKRLGIAGSRNLAITIARGKYIAFVEMDMELDKNWLTKAVAKLEKEKNLGGIVPICFDFHKRNRVIAAGIYIIPHTSWTIGRGFGTTKDKFTKESYTSTGAVGSVIRKDVLYNIGGYDEGANLIDDIDMGWRVWMSGNPIKFIPNSIVYHWTGKPWTMRKESTKFSKEFDLARHIRLIMKNYELKNVIYYLPQCITIIIVRMILNVLKGNFIPLRGGLSSFWWQLLNIRDTLSKRKQIQSTRKLSDEELFGKVFMKGSFISLYLGHSHPALKISQKWYEERSHQVSKT